METTFIYFLKDPENPMKGYVGKSNNPKARLRSHLKDSRDQTYRTNWVKSLTERSLKPMLEIIDEVPTEFWPQLEVAYIEYFKEAGYELVNSSPGGDGVHHTPETRSKIGAYHLGKKRSPETCARISAALMGKEVSVETRAKYRAANLGKKASEASKTKASASMLGKKNSLGFKHLPERCAKQRIKKSGSSSQFHGVSWIKARKKWFASISVSNKRIFLGRFSDEIEAARTYDIGAKKHCGEFAKLNFP